MGGWGYLNGNNEWLIFLQKRGNVRKWGGHLKMGGGGGVKQPLPTMAIDTLKQHMVTDHITRPRDANKFSF